MKLGSFLYLCFVVSIIILNLRAIMGLTYADVVVFSLDRKTEKNIHFLVDTGSLHSLLPGSMVKELGLEEVGEVELELADMQVITRPYTFAIFQYEDDRLGAANVIIGENNVEPLLGATALEAMNLSVDPTKNQVVKNRVAKLKYFSR
ncbi:MAG: hypothetical protein FVQ77_09760 [Cytophagales bacterium]|nr:hypothetical protein [Cytophagales bacterium]